MPIKSALVRTSGATTKSRTLKTSAKAIEPKAAAEPRFNSSSGRFRVGTGKSPGTPPVMPAKSPSPSTTAGVKATAASFASSPS
jgi:hypothetical protein